MGGKRRKKKGKKPSPRKEISPSPKEIKPKPKKGRWFFIVFPLLVIGAISLILLPPIYRPEVQISQGESPPHLHRYDASGLPELLC